MAISLVPQERQRNAQRTRATAAGTRSEAYEGAAERSGVGGSVTNVSHRCVRGSDTLRDAEFLAEPVEHGLVAVAIAEDVTSPQVTWPGVRATEGIEPLTV
jgi:hypothetical protein